MSDNLMGLSFNWRYKNMKEFVEKIKKFNEMYGVESNDVPTNLGPERIVNFQNILTEEISEGSDIVTQCVLDDTPEIDTLTDMADWLCDIMVYCASECRRWGIPMEQVLDIIMESNFSKLGEDGLPIKDERGKILKGPNFFKPEAKIKELLEGIKND